MRFLRSCALLAFGVLLLSFWSRHAAAHSNPGPTSSMLGTSGCFGTGCHGGGPSPSVSFTADSTCLGLCTNIECGSVPDGCSAFVDCGACPTGKTCNSGVCANITGQSCSVPGDCASGFCAGGVCCDSTCDGQCQTCSTGTCSNAPASQPCGPSTSCVGATISAGGHCSGASDQTCELSIAQPCPGQFVCGSATACKTSCASNADCAGTTCDVASGTCRTVDGGVADTGTSDTGVSTDSGASDSSVAQDSGSTGADAGPPVVVGPVTHCSAGSQCTSGFCVDGVCCDTACTEKCHTCALPSSPGTCVPEPIGVDLRHECGAALTCLGTCDGSGACAGASAGTQCDPNKCTGQSTGVGAAVCAGPGANCPVADVVAFDCGDYACDPAFGACKTVCTSTDDCADGRDCDVGSKTCVGVQPSGSSGGCGCVIAGGETELAGGGLAALVVSIFAARRRRRAA